MYDYVVDIGICGENQRMKPKVLLEHLINSIEHDNCNLLGIHPSCDCSIYNGSSRRFPTTPARHDHSGGDCSSGLCGLEF